MFNWIEVDEYKHIISYGKSTKKMGLPTRNTVYIYISLKEWEMVNGCAGDLNEGSYILNTINRICGVTV